jgi:outer membrane lipoprotein-sorting protein
MLQFIHDNKGNTTGIFIPIEEWQILKLKYTELQKEESSVELSDWQKNMLEDRLEDYNENSSQVEDFDAMLKDIATNI